jgi:hypothetical protein
VRLERRVIVGAGLAVAVLAAIVVIATSLSRPVAGTEVGVVVSVESVSLTDVRRFVIRTADGRNVEFTIGVLENGAQFPPGHLGEHMATAQPVRVTYRDEGAQHVAVRIDDAPAASPT